MSTEDRLIVATSDDFELSTLSMLKCDSTWLVLLAQSAAGPTGFGVCGPAVHRVFEGLLLPALRVHPAAERCELVKPGPKNIWMQTSLLIRGNERELADLRGQYEATLAVRSNNVLRSRLGREPRELPESVVYEAVQSLPHVSQTLARRFETWYGAGLRHGDSALNPTDDLLSGLERLHQLCAREGVALFHAKNLADLPVW